MAVVIEQISSDIVLDPRKYLHYLHGDAGVGKTTWCKQIPGHYFAKCENGTMGLKVFGSSINSWPDFLEMLLLLVKQKESNWEGVREVKTVIVDTYDYLFELAGEWVAQNVKFMVQGKTIKYARIEQVPFGDGFSVTRRLTLSKIRKFMALGFGVILVGHTKEKVIKWRGQDLTVKRLNLSPTTAEAVVSACDAVGYCTIEETIERNDQGQITSVETGRYIHWQKEFQISAKHRLQQFPSRTALNNQKSKGLLGYELYLEAFEKAAHALQDEE